MDIWQFWLSIGIFFALLGLIVAVLVKKHKEKHRIIGLQKDMNALEQSFHLLQEEFDNTVDRNLETMNEQCKRMSDLITIADKKCIFVGDLLANIDKEATILKEKNLSANPNTISFDENKIQALIDEKLLSVITEFKNEINRIERHLGYFNTRMEELENTQAAKSSVETEFDEKLIKDLNIDLSNIKKEISNLKSSISELVTNEISNQLNGLDAGFAEIANQAIDISENQSNLYNQDFSTNSNGKITELFPKIADSPNSTHNRKKEIFSDLNQEDSEVFLPKGKELVVKEILEKYSQGISIPQIASEIKMSRGEIDLIIKMNKKLNNIKKVGNYGN